MNLDNLIEYEVENTCLDFKASEYGKDNEALIKDIMSMANANSNATKYIILGVKDDINGEREIIGLDEVSDQAILENIIQENVESIIEFKYYKYLYKSKKLGIIEIYDNNDKPYMMKKDYKNLKKGDSWIRKGSRQSRVVKEDINEMLKNKMNYFDYRKLKIGIGSSLSNEMTLKFPVINYENRPSNVKKRHLRSLLEKLKEFEQEEFTINDLIMQLGSPEYRAATKEIRIGYDRLGFPIYCNEKKLLEKIARVEEDYVEEDNYFFFEENSVKLNFSIYNDNNIFLEDVKIEFNIPKDVFLVAERILEKPEYDSFGMKLPPSFIMRYPNVELENNYYVVTEYFDNIRHKDLTRIFSEDLRCCKVRKYKGNKINIKYKISAKNLDTPIEGTLDLKWE